jgi:DNA-binding transcriptional ArsR family regulator
MKRDMDLIRQILLKVEQNNDPNKAVIVHIAGRSEGEVSYHILLLSQAGLVKALHIRDGNGDERWSVFHLTWQGHDFLDTIRVKSQIKDRIKSQLTTKIKDQT